MYFSKFPEIYYDFKINNEQQLKVVRDITANVRIRTRVLSDITLYDYYDMKEGETPEIVAHRFYGNAELHWVIMLLNNRYDYVEDFPLSAHNLEKHINRKYGNQRTATHHYEKDGIIVDPTVVLDAVGVSNSDYEYALNDAKRRIKLVRPQVVGKLVQELEDLLEEQI